MCMSEQEALIPPPPIVRDRLARSLREARLLRHLLRLAVAAAEERHRETAPDSPQTAAGKDGVH
jgi:hypothetical protein